MAASVAAPIFLSIECRARALAACTGHDAKIRPILAASLNLDQEEPGPPSGIPFPMPVRTAREFSQELEWGRHGKPAPY